MKNITLILLSTITSQFSNADTSIININHQYVREKVQLTSQRDNFKTWTESVPSLCTRKVVDHYVKRECANENVNSDCWGGFEMDPVYRDEIYECNKLVEKKQYIGTSEITTSIDLEVELVSGAQAENTELIATLSGENFTLGLSRPSNLLFDEIERKIHKNVINSSANGKEEIVGTIKVKAYPINLFESLKLKEMKLENNLLNFTLYSSGTTLPLDTKNVELKLTRALGLDIVVRNSDVISVKSTDLGNNLIQIEFDLKKRALEDLKIGKTYKVTLNGLGLNLVYPLNSYDASKTLLALHQSNFSFKEKIELE